MLLASVAGFVDTLGFVALFGLFTAHVTGNFVLIGAELVQPGRGVALKLLAFPVFILAVAAARWTVISRERTGHSSLSLLIGLQSLLLLAFMACGLMSECMPDRAHPWSYAAGLFGAAAMGLQNASSKMLLATLTPSTVMTGNVTQLVIETADWLAGHRSQQGQKRIGQIFWTVASFATGAMAGAMGHGLAGYMALTLPMFAIAYVALVGIGMSPRDVD